VEGKKKHAIGILGAVHCQKKKKKTGPIASNQKEGSELAFGKKGAELSVRLSRGRGM